MTYLLRWMSEEQTYSNEEVEMNSKLQSQEMNWERELKPTVMRISSWTQDFLDLIISLGVWRGCASLRIFQNCHQYLSVHGAHHLLQDD